MSAGSTTGALAAVGVESATTVIKPHAPNPTPFSAQTLQFWDDPDGNIPLVSV